MVEHAFILLDGLDILVANPELHALVRDKLADCRADGWRILVTSRFQCTKYKFDCDVRTNYHAGDIEDPDIWWFCKLCREVVVCDSCKAKGDGCPEHATRGLVQPDKALLELDDDAILEMEINHIPEDHLEAFIRYYLEIEHGDVGLRDDATAEATRDHHDLPLPPLSELGKSLRDSGSAGELVKRLRERSGDNIAMALLRLEHIRECTTAEEAMRVDNRLPDTIVAAFTAGVDRIRAATTTASEPGGGRRNLGLDAIRIVATCKVTGESGMPWSDLEQSLADRGWPDVSKADVLVASAGFLRNGFATIGPQRIKCYTHPFYLFASEHYHESLLPPPPESRPEGASPELLPVASTTPVEEKWTKDVVVTVRPVEVTEETLVTI